MANGIAIDGKSAPSGGPRRWLYLLVGFTYLLSFLAEGNKNGADSGTCNNNDANEDTAEFDKLQDRLSQDIVDWIRSSETGYVNEKVQLRKPLDGQDGPRGIYANEALEEGDVVCTIPWDLIAKPSKEEKDPEDECGTIRAVYKDMKEGLTPYGKYLESMPRRYLPGWWSDNGRALLKDMVGPKLPPQGLDRQSWSLNAGGRKRCGGDLNDELWSHAVMMVVARADDYLMVPFYDMINHRNGDYLNTRHNTKYGESYQLITTRKIAAGEQLQNSYNQCTVCGGRKHWFGTPDMFETYGFVENYPQRWYVSQIRLKFDIMEKGEDGSGDLVVKFAVPPSIWAVSYMEEEVARLLQFAQERKHDKALAGSMPQFEFDTIWQYHSAVVTAFRTAIESSKGKISEEVWSCGCDWWEVEDYEKEGCTYEYDDDYEYEEEEE